MKCVTHYEHKQANTTNGQYIIVTSIYSSFDENEINALEEKLKDTIGSGVVSEFDLESVSK